jgi:hypothetical protein
MKEESKYNKYRFVGKEHISLIQPWFDFDRGKSWDEREVPWPLENKVRRQILIILAREGPKTFAEIINYIRFSPKPIIISQDEYVPKVKYHWSEEVIENHILNLEWYKLVKKTGDKYEVTFPVLEKEMVDDLEKYVDTFAENWIEIIKTTKNQIGDKFSKINKDGKSLYQILIDKATEELYELLKKEGLLPQEPNIKALYAEELRKNKFEQWVLETF